MEGNLTLLDQILIALALAMDCFTVSIASGLILKKIYIKTTVITALMFGIFQAAMPAIGWSVTKLFNRYIENFDHWIAFGLLAVIGIKMIIDNFKAEDEKTFNPCSICVILTMAVATSIDALAVGISFMCAGLKTWHQLIQPLFIIGITSAILSVAGNMIGVYIGRKIKLPVEMIGGIILIIIGVKILSEHLGW